MARTKNADKRPRGESSQAGSQQEHTTSEFDKKKFRSSIKFSRYLAIRLLQFIKERRVELLPEQYEVFQHELQRRRLRKLATLPKKFNPDIFKYFYANAYSTNQQARRESFVLGKRILYDRDTISAYLEDQSVLDDDGLCGYQRMMPPKARIINNEIMPTLCISGWEAAKKQIKRPQMKTLTQIWMSFLSSNIKPTLHTSGINMSRACLIYCIMEQVSVDVASIISDEIHRIATTKEPATLIFPSLITQLCKDQGVNIPDQPQLKIRPAINDDFIRQRCMNPDEEIEGAQPAQPVALPIPSPQQPIDPMQQMLLLQEQMQLYNRNSNRQMIEMFSRQEFMYTRQEQLYNRQEHIFRQEAANFRASDAIYQQSYAAPVHEGSPPYRWLSYDEFQLHCAWPGDRPIFEEGEGSQRAATGTTTEAGADGAEEERAEKHMVDQMLADQQDED